MTDHLPLPVVAGNDVANGVAFNHDTERQVIVETLQRHNGNRTRAAAELGVHRSTLWRKLKSYGLVS